MMTAKLNPVVEAVTARIEERSKDSRAAYLEMIRSRRPPTYARSRLTEGNLAHQSAGCAVIEKSQILGAGWVTIIAPTLVAAPRVAESPVSFECRVSQIIPLQTADGAPIPTWLVMGEVVAVHIARHLIRDGVYDTAAAEPIMRGGGPADYFGVTEAQRFRMARPR